MKKILAAIGIISIVSCTDGYRDVRFRARSLGTYGPSSTVSLLDVDSAFRVGDTIQIDQYPYGKFILTERVK